MSRILFVAKSQSKGNAREHYLQAVICRSRERLSANEKKEKKVSNDNGFCWLLPRPFSFLTGSPRADGLCDWIKITWFSYLHFLLENMLTMRAN